MSYDPDAHNPDTCTRDVCRRCAGPHEPAPPAPAPRVVRDVPPPKPHIHGLHLTEFAHRLHDLADRLTHAGETVWQRFHDWQTVFPPGKDERGGGNGGTTSDDVHRNQLEDRRVARYFAEYVDLLENMLGPVNRLHRLHDLAEVEDRSVHRTRTGELDPLLASEAAAAGYCASCWRYEQTCFEREKDGDGHYYDRNHCRRCARFRNEHGVLPPVDLLRLWHGLGRRTWTTAEVNAALTKARAKKAS